jgi:hypothetical protein
MCTVLLPPGGYPIAVKYIMYIFHIKYINFLGVVNCLFEAIFRDSFDSLKETSFMKLPVHFILSSEGITSGYEAG